MTNLKKIIGKIIGSDIYECPYCMGDGLDEDMKTCSKCDGTGSYVK